MHERSPQYALLLVGTLCSVALLWLLGWLRTGGLYFSLDDPYIHQAFAEQLVQGHIGASPEITSFPVSSPIWPLLLVPGAWVGLGNAGNFFVILGCLVLTTAAAWSAAREIKSPILPTAALFVVAGNAVPLAIVGMEHLLHVALAIAAAAAVLRLERERLPWWGLVAVAMMPLVRLEGLGLAGVVAVYSAWRGDRRALIAVALSIVALAVFCVTAYSHTGHWLPGSVLSKLSSIPAAWTAPEHPWVLGLWVVVVLGLLPLGGRRDLGAMASAVAMGHLIFGRASDHDRYVPYALAVGAVWLWASLCTPSETRKTPSPMAKGIVFLLLTIIHIPSWYSQPVLMRRTYTMHGAIWAIREAAHAPIGTHDIGMASRGSEYPVVDLLGLANVPILNGWLAGSPLPAIESEMARYDAHLAIGIHTFFGTVPRDWRLVAMLEPKAGDLEGVVKRLAVYATHPRWVDEVRDIVSRADIDARRRVVWHASRSAPGEQP